MPRHTSAAFVEFLGDIVATQPKRREIHVIADNLSTHKTQAVRSFLLAHPHVHLHFTPTYSSWLNQVELWFAKIERDLLARGIFTSVADLARKTRRYMRHYNKTANPIRWSYCNPAHRISSTSVSTVQSLKLSCVGTGIETVWPTRVVVFGSMRRYLEATGVLVLLALTACRSEQTVTPLEQGYRLNNAGVARLEQFDYAKAVVAFRRALQITPSLTIARLNLAIALLYQGDLQNAGVAARTAAAQIPEDPHSHYVLGLIAREENRLGDALASFTRVLSLDPDDVGSRIQIGQVQLFQREYREAVGVFSAALAREPFNATAAYGLATALGRSNDPRAEPAMARYEALRDEPAAITYSATYLEQGRYAEAIASTGLEPDLVDLALPAVRFRDATVSMLGAEPVAGRAALVDADGDGDLDVVVGGADRVRLLVNSRGRLNADNSWGPQSRADGGVLVADYDNDSRADVLTLVNGRPRLYRQKSGGFQEVGLPDTENATSTSTAAFVDLDHDGDLDIVMAPPNRALRNNGNDTFTDVTATARLAGGDDAVAIVPSDFDNRRDVDLVVLGASTGPKLFANQRDGTFRDVSSEVRFSAPGVYAAAATADVNKDGSPDFVLTRRAAPAALATTDGHGRFVMTALPPVTRDAVACAFFDYDNDGLFDLFLLTTNGPLLLRKTAAGWTDVSSRALAGVIDPTSSALVAVAMGDLDADGDTDILVESASGIIRVWRNEGGNRSASVAVRLSAQVSNRSALGAKVEVRAGSLRQRLETSAVLPPVSSATLLFGLGVRQRADVVRVLWPAGIVQSEVNPTQPITTMREINRKASSCPYLFAWNGTRFDFVTDFMGGGEIGYLVAPGVYSPPDPDEYVRITEAQLRPRNGLYEFRVTNELEEALFVDRLRLLAVAHPEGVALYPDEGLRSPAARRPLSLSFVRGSRPPTRATDERGVDVLNELATLDRRYVDRFPLESIQGYAKPHALVLDLGSFDAGADVRLLLTGWTDYAFSADNVAAEQAGLPFLPPSLQIQDRKGDWQTVIAEVGVPVGRPQTVAVNLTPFLPRPAADVRVRILTTLRVYWDQVLVGTSRPVPHEIAYLDPVLAHLRTRGFSAESTEYPPFTYDYSRVLPHSPWKSMPGRYTREGDVLPLLLASDDHFVIAASGDEIALEFDAASLEPLPSGWTRTYLLYADGFSKEMNLHSASPDRLEPLPFHAMSNYPYTAPERYPQTPAHTRYRETYNTRVIGGPLPPIDAISASEIETETK